MTDSGLAIGIHLVCALDENVGPEGRHGRFVDSSNAGHHKGELLHHDAGDYDDSQSRPLCAQEEAMEMNIDVDVFRPTSDFFEDCSSLQQEPPPFEYDGSLASAWVQQPGDLANLDQEWVDLEQMLLMEDQLSFDSERRGAHHGTGRSGIALQLLHLHAIAANTANTTNSTTTNNTMDNDLCGSSPSGAKAHHQVRCLTSDGRVFCIGKDQAKANSLPPKYFQGVESSPRKNRVHRRTFGIVDKSFSFASGLQSPNGLQTKQKKKNTLERACPLPLPASSSKVTTTRPKCSYKHKVATGVCPHREVTSRLQRQLESKRRHALQAIDNEEQLGPAPQNQQQPQCQLEPSSSSSSSSSSSTNIHDENVCPTGAQVHATGPNPPMNITQVRSCNATKRETPSDEIKQEPLSSPKATTISALTMHLDLMTTKLCTPPGQIVTAATSSTTGVHTTLSPTGSVVTTTKASSLMHLNREVVTTGGKLGRVGKFQWKVTSKPSATAAVQQKLLTKDFGKCRNALPPRYYRVATSSPQKSRVHSSTFGSFARSFSFSSLETT